MTVGRGDLWFDVLSAIMKVKPVPPIVLDAVRT
jgi:hypothetical protein